MQTYSGQRPFSWGTVPWRRGWNAYCSPCSACPQEWRCDALWYTDIETDVFVLVLALRKNLTLKRCYMKNGRGANVICNSTRAMLATASWGALVGVNTGCPDVVFVTEWIHSFFFIRMLFSRARLNILIFPPILGCKYSCIILNNSLWHFRFRIY